MNSLPDKKIQYLVTNLIYSIQNRPNSLCLTKYRTYLVGPTEKAGNENCHELSPEKAKILNRECHAAKGKQTCSCFEA